MTQDVAMGTVPEITLGWRMRLALHPMPAKEMAKQLGVNRGTVTRWMDDKTPVRPIYLKQWALITGVDYNWLVSGKVPTPSGGGGLRDSPAKPRVHANSFTPAPRSVLELYAVSSVARAA